MVSPVKRVYENHRKEFEEITDFYEEHISKLRLELKAAKEEVECLKDSRFRKFQSQKSETVILEEISRFENIRPVDSPVTPRIRDEISRSPLHMKFPENKFLQFSFGRPGFQKF